MKHIAILFMILFFISNGHAIVDMKSAAYTNTWTDLQIPGSGYELRVLRAYRSRTLYNGLFGFGWCSEFETKLTITSTGSLKINECGDGQETEYYTKRPTAEEIESAVENILQKIKMKSPTLSASYLKDLKQRMKKDSALREKYAVENSISAPIAKDTKLWANGLEAEYVISEKNYYTRRFVDGSSQRFDADGRLTHVYNKNGQFLKLEYGEKNLTEVADDTGRKLTFKFYANGKLQKVSGPDSTSVEYKFNNSDDLVSARITNAKGLVEEYLYEYNEYHNLIKASWPDKTFISIKYDNKKDWVMSFTDRDLCIEVYKYESSKDQPELHYWATNAKSCHSEVVAKSRYEFWHKAKPSGEIVQTRILTKIKNDVKDTYFNEDLQKPEKIIFNGQVTAFTYYADGLPKSKKVGDRLQEYTYDETNKKIIKIGDGKEFSKFKYDKKGNLIYVENSVGKKLDLTYDLSGRIKTIFDNNEKTKVTIDYEDKFGKPSLITKVGEGSVNITYTSDGDIQKVESKLGSKVAAQIAGTFNSFLEIIAPVNQAGQ